MKDQTQANPVFDQLLVGNKLHDDALPGVPQGPIIFGTVTGRQRVVRPILAALITFGGLACGANNSLEAAQTAVVAAQTVLPGAQATAQAGATLVSNAVTVAQPVFLAVQGLLQGVSLNVTTSPPGAENDAVTDVTIQGTDTAGRLGGIDAQTRQTAAAAALVAVGQYYPKANVSLTVVDASGNTLVSGSLAPGQSPTVQ
jgi:hypothetical protein